MRLASEASLKEARSLIRLTNEHDGKGRTAHRNGKYRERVQCR
jgi:hypothetical protein